jgi:hypothetical protein
VSFCGDSERCTSTDNTPDHVFGRAASVYAGAVQVHAASGGELQETQQQQAGGQQLAGLVEEASRGLCWQQQSLTASTIAVATVSSTNLEACAHPKVMTPRWSAGLLAAAI